MFRHRCHATVQGEDGSVVEAKLGCCKFKERLRVMRVELTSVKFHELKRV